MFWLTVSRGTSLGMAGLADEGSGSAKEADRGEPEAEPGFSL